MLPQKRMKMILQSTDGLFFTQFLLQGPEWQPIRKNMGGFRIALSMYWVRFQRVVNPAILATPTQSWLTFCEKITKSPGKFQFLTISMTWHHAKWIIIIHAKQSNKQSTWFQIHIHSPWNILIAPVLCFRLTVTNYHAESRKREVLQVPENCWGQRQEILFTVPFCSVEMWIDSHGSLRLWHYSRLSLFKMLLDGINKVLLSALDNKINEKWFSLRLEIDPGKGNQMELGNFHHPKRRDKRHNLYQWSWRPPKK